MTTVARWTIGTGGFKGDILLCEPTECILWFQQPRPGVRMLEVECLYVHPLRRNYGWGRKLMDAALAHCDMRGWDTVLRVTPHGPRRTKAGTQVPLLPFSDLRLFYMSFGYKLVQEPEDKPREWLVPKGGVLFRKHR